MEFHGTPDPGIPSNSMVAQCTMEFLGGRAYHGIPWWPSLPEFRGGPLYHGIGTPGHHGIPWYSRPPWNSMVSPATMEFRGNPGHHGIPWYHHGIPWYTGMVSQGPVCTPPPSHSPLSEKALRRCSIKFCASCVIRYDTQLLCSSVAIHSWRVWLLSGKGLHRKPKQPLYGSAQELFSSAVYSTGTSQLWP